MTNSWVKDAIFYHIYPLGFCGAPQYNSDNDEIVPNYNLEKLVQWIPHLKDIGVNALYLGPVFESLEHGYDTKDYYRIDRRLSDNEGFKSLCDTLHENGIKIVLDGVFNHVGREFWAFKDVQKNGQNSKYCSWFQNLNFGGGSPMGDPFWYESWEGHYNLVKLNLHNSEVLDHIMNAVSMWIDYFGIDGIRLDVAYSLPEDFLRNLKNFCRQRKDDFWLMGEAIHGDYNRIANDTMLDSVTNYECYKGIYSSHNDKNYFEIAYSLNRQFGNGGIYSNIYTYNFVDNHDVNRLMSTLKNPIHAYNCYTLLFTTPGAPSIYYGSEWGITGVKGSGTDAPLRPCIDINNIQNPDCKLNKHISKLSKARKELISLKEGDYSQVIVKNQQYVFKRSFANEATYISLNLSDYEDNLYFNIGTDNVLIDVLDNNNVYYSEGGNISLHMPAYNSKILVLRNKNDIDGLFKTDGIENLKKDKEIYKGMNIDFHIEKYEVLDIATEIGTLEKTAILKNCHNDDLWTVYVSKLV